MSNDSNYQAMTLPLQCRLSTRADTSSFPMMVAVSEHLSQPIGDLGQIMQILDPLSLSIVLRNTIDEYAVKGLTNENTNQLFQICRKEMGYTMLISF